MRNVYIILLLITIMLSCGDGKEQYNSVYLSLPGHEYLYVYNQDEEYLCVDGKIPYCQERYNLTLNTNLNTSYIDTHIVYDSNENIAVMTEGYTTYIMFNNRGFSLIRYVSSYPVNMGHFGNAYLSIIQSPGQCDVSILLNIFNKISSMFGLNLKFDLYSASSNPEFCRFSNLMACAMAYGNDLDFQISKFPNVDTNLDIANNNDVNLVMSIQCFSFAYNVNNAISRDE